jgi:2-amino-4-hydroxy-6-hydroxymethyldihydropteridine diphosphokinase
LTLCSLALSLGSNLGNSAGKLEETIKIIRGDGLVAVEKVSSVYETEAVDCPPQPPFFNQVLSGKSGLNPGELLEYCLRIENDLGRKRGIYKGPRLIDIDILFYGNAIIKSDDLALPHKAIPHRSSILVPLAEICPGWIHPVIGLCAKEMLSFYGKKGEVKKLSPVPDWSLEGGEKKRGKD